MLKTMTRSTTGDGETHKPLDESPLRFKHHLSRLTRKDRSEHPISQRQPSSTNALSVMKDRLRRSMSPDQGLVKRSQESFRQRSPPRDTLQRDMVTWRDEVVRLECLKKLETDIPQAKGENVYEDHGWMENTMRDITNKGHEIRGVYACIRTTTTTGSDPQPSPSSPTRDSSNNLEELHDQMKRSSMQVTCNQPETGVGKTSTTTCQPKVSSSTTPNLMLVRGTPATGTTSVRQLAPTKQRTEQLVTRSTDATLATRGAKEACSTLPTSTSIPHQDVEHGDAKLSPHNSLEVRELVELAENLGILRQNIDKRRIAIGSGPKSSEVKKTQPVPASRVTKLEAELQSLMARTPGSYPAHLDVADGIADPSNWHSDRSKEVSDYFDSSDDMNELSIVYHHGAVALYMYWELVRPICDPKSGYWQRYARQEATWRDGVVVGLAIPGAVLAAAVFVWGMRIVAIVGMFAGQVLGMLGKEVLLLFG